jgi:hypothetical protein
MSAIDNRQQREINSLKRALQSFNKKKRQPRKKSAITRNFDPIHTAIRARFVPFDTEKGIASPLSDGRPSQKFMAKAQAQITLTSGQGFCFMVGANAASDSTRASVVFAIGAFTSGVFTTDGSWQNLTVGDQVGPFGTIQRLGTNTPYTAATLADGYEYACVGAGLKFTYEGSELYRGGTLRYLYDKEAAYNSTNSWSGDSVNGVINFVNSAPNTVRQSINKDNVVEINTTPTYDGYVEQSAAAGGAYGGTGESFTSTIGGTTGTTQFCIKPAVLGYYANTSGNTISFHVDVVEHWSITNPVIQSLQTPSYAHAPMSTHVAALMDNVRQAHAGSPNVKHLDVTKTTLSAMKSPIGHEVLNAGIRAALL